MWNRLAQAAIITFLLSIVVGNRAVWVLRAAPHSATVAPPLAQHLFLNRPPLELGLKLS